MNKTGRILTFDFNVKSLKSYFMLSFHSIHCGKHEIKISFLISNSLLAQIKATNNNMYIVQTSNTI